MKIFRKGFFLSANCKKDRSSKKISVFSFTHFPSSHSKNMAYLYRASQDGEWKGERVVQTLISLWGPTGASCQVACLILSSSKTRPCLWRFHMHSFVRSQPPHLPSIPLGKIGSQCREISPRDVLLKTERATGAENAAHLSHHRPTLTCFSSPSFLLLQLLGWSILILFI